MGRPAQGRAGDHRRHGLPGCDRRQNRVEHQADYLLALKGNQPTLEAEVADFFRSASALEVVSKTVVEEGHGRIETRTYTASSKIVSERSYPGEPRFTTSRRSSRSICSASTPINPLLSTPPPHLVGCSRYRPARQCSPGVIGARRVCIGCSTLNSKTICRATIVITAPRTSPSCAALRWASFAPIKANEASKHEENLLVGTQTIPSSCLVRQHETLSESILDAVRPQKSHWDMIKWST